MAHYDEEVRARFDAVSDACRDAFAAGGRPDERLLHEFFALQRNYLRGCVGKQLHQRLSHQHEDVLMYIAERMLRSLHNGNTLHWHMLWSTYRFCIIDYDRRSNATPTTPLHDDIDSGDDREDPIDRVDERLDLICALHRMLAALKAGPEAIGNPERMRKVLTFHLADVTNNAEIARMLNVPEGTLKREWNELRHWVIARFPELRNHLDADDACDEVAS